MVVIGDGLIASAFKKSQIKDKVLIIASGVSNSKENRYSEFLREKNLINDLLSFYSGMTLIYFSTCSIYQTEQTPYIRHKLNIEELITTSNFDYIIFRLPQVVGVVDNDTLVSYLVRNAYLNKPLKIQRNAYRNLVDIDDLVPIVKKIIKSKISYGKIINVASSSYLKVYDIAKIITSKLNSDSLIDVIPGGEKYYIDNLQLKFFLGEKEIIFNEIYSINVIEKYTIMIASEFSKNWEKPF